MFPPNEDLPPPGPNPGDDNDGGPNGGGPDDDHIWKFGPNMLNVHVEDEQAWDQATNAAQHEITDLEQAEDNHRAKWILAPAGPPAVHFPRLNVVEIPAASEVSTRSVRSQDVLYHVPWAALPPILPHNPFDFSMDTLSQEMTCPATPDGSLVLHANPVSPERKRKGRKALLVDSCVRSERLLAIRMVSGVICKKTLIWGLGNHGVRQ
uniref:Uncharacterized protein n=1 Tax=Oryza punctata TaxID=4537 RepID=A0A0E0L0H6_ORYPU